MEISDSTDEIIIGTNEEFILGYALLMNEDGSVSLEPSFTNHAHIGRVKQVAICKNFLVTGSTDEFIKIFNLRTRREVGSILQQEGTINCLHFHDSGFLFSASEDGTIGIFKMGKWELIKELKGHAAAVTGLAVHPTGKLALSISKDKRVITWDLMKGKKAHQAGLKKAGEYVMWSPDGSHYLIACANILNIYSVAHGGIVHTIDFKENIYCFCYLNDNIVVVGGERKSLALFDLESKTQVMEWEAHSSRTKCLVLIDNQTELVRQFASASSDGFIKIWTINLSNITNPPKLLGEVNTTSRIICMALKPKRNQESHVNAEVKDITQPKKKRKRDESKNRKTEEKSFNKKSYSLESEKETNNNNNKLASKLKNDGKNLLDNNEAAVRISEHSFKKNKNKAKKKSDLKKLPDTNNLKGIRTKVNIMKQKKKLNKKKIKN